MRFAFLTLLMSFSCENVYSQPRPLESEPLKFPVNSLVQDEYGICRCFNLESFKVLLFIYNDYKSWFHQIKEQKQKILYFTRLGLNYEERLTLEKHKVTELEKARKVLFDKWTEENRKRHLAENKPMWGSWVSWGIAGVASVALTTLAVIYASNR